MVDEAALVELAELVAMPPAELRSWLEARELRLENPLVLDLIKALWPYPAGMKRRIAIDFVVNARRRRGHTLPRTATDVIQQALERFCVDSDVYKARGAPPADGLFHWPRGAGAGFWAIHRDKAEAWLRKKGIRPI